MRLYCFAVAALGWFALVLQYLIAFGDRRGAALLAGTINFFSYFTILSNLLAAVLLTAAGLRRRPAPPALSGAVALYMAVTGLVYVLLLRQLWQPEGWQFVADALLHYLMPALYLVHWLLFLPKGTLRPRHALVWLAFPVGFAVYSLIHGALSGFYPYPFIDVAALGYPAVLRNMAGLTLAFAALGLLLVAVDGRLARRGPAVG
jgi:hypothetical protein